MRSVADEAQQVAEACPIALSLDVLGQKWTILIIREALRGARRFSEFEEALGCPRNLLAARLRLLCHHRILEVAPYETPGQRPREHYELTAAGRELAPTLIALFDWGMKYAADDSPLLAQPSRCQCGATIHVALSCENGHDIRDINTVEFPQRTLASSR